MAFANQPLPSGNRVAIVTNAGGPGIILADACEAHGLRVTALGSETEGKLRSGLPEEASVRNPVDMIASATAKSYAFALGCVFDDPGVDAVIAAFVPPLGIQTQDVARAIVRVNEGHPEKPILAVLMGRQGLPAGVAELHEARVPAYIFPESAARALGAMWRYRHRRERPAGKPVAFETEDAKVERIIDTTLADGRRKLSEPDVLKLLGVYDIRVAPWRYVSKDSGRSLPTAAAEAAGDVGFPVAAKIVSPDIVHKTDVGGVVLGLETKAAVERAVRQMVRSVGAKGKQAKRRREPAIDGVLVQQMASGGTETIVGLTRMPRVGPLVMFGLGGIYVEVMRDVVLRLSPLLDADADEMIREVKLFRLLEGVRGQDPRDLEALAETILRISQLAQRHPRIAEMDINPLLALSKGVLAIDARVQLGEQE